MPELFDNFILLFSESAPYLLLGLLIAGIIHMLIPKQWITRYLGEKSSVVTAAIIGTPLPLCSCSVIPTAIGIRRAGASKASTASFMVATPETGVDSIGVTYALMGPLMAIVRPISAIASAITAGTLVRLWDKEDNKPDTQQAQSSCCSKQQSSEVAQQQELNQELSLGQKLAAAIKYGYGKLLTDFMGWLLIGIGFAALIQTYVPASFMTEYGSGIIAMLITVLISIPMYICATASTPIAAGLMLSGVSPGAALVFMLTGPASNIATLMVVKNELGLKSLLAYLTGVIATAIASGLALDWALEYFQINIQVSHGHHDDMTSLLYSASAVILAGLIFYQYVKKFIHFLKANNTRLKQA